MTPAQNILIKADILANADLNSQPNIADGAFEIARLYSLEAVPTWTVWKSNVPIGTVGKAFNGTELAGISATNQSRLQTIAHFLIDGVNPSLLDNRQFFDDVFSGAGGTNTRANLSSLWKRPANRLEKLLSTGTGTSLSPATLSFEGTISYQDVQIARNS